jgi:hypothetical protein
MSQERNGDNGKWAVCGVGAGSGGGAAGYVCTGCAISESGAHGTGSDVCCRCVVPPLVTGRKSKSGRAELTYATRRARRRSAGVVSPHTPWTSWAPAELHSSTTGHLSHSARAAP